MIGYALIGALVLSTGTFFYGQKLEAVKHTKRIATLEGTLAQIHKDSVDRDERDRQASARVRVQAKADAVKREADRAKWIADARAAWDHELRAAGGERDAADPLSACRVARDATRAGLERVLTAAEQARARCDDTRAQLGALLGWLNGVTR